MSAIPAPEQGGSSDPVGDPSARPGYDPLLILFVLGVALMCLPTMFYVANTTWNSEQGSHGPIVLLTGLWLAFRLWPGAVRVAKRPPLVRAIIPLVFLVPAFMLAKITQIIELEGFLMYGCVLTALYSVVGGATLRRLWFPIFYLAFIFPPPDTLVAIITVPLKIWVSHAAIWLLKLCGYPIGGVGVSIYIGQYTLLVAAACSGLNSLISLAAISLFYIYMRHQAEWKYALFLALLTVPVALAANLVRVIILILLTYHLGNAAGEGFLHNFAGVTMFAASVLIMFGVDALLKPLWERLFGKSAPASDNPFAI